MDRAEEFTTILDDLICSAHFNKATQLINFSDMAENMLARGYRKKSETSTEILTKVGEIFVCDYEGGERQIKELYWFRKLCEEYGVKYE